MKNPCFAEPPAPPLVRDRARKLRRTSTDVERKPWARLRGGQVYGAKFRRQHAIGPYITDFFCLAARLVVELDGGGPRRRGATPVRRRPYGVSRKLRLQGAAHLEQRGGGQHRWSRRENQ